MKSSAKDPYKLRLQVFLSRNGVCSRRRALDMVQEGRVKLNGQVCREPSTPVEPGKDCVDVDGKNIKGKAYDYILMNKPAGVTTTKADRFAQRTVLD
jgi:23S rRNA pseudouridine2605 synthase